MKAPASKDILFVSIQVLLFMVYFFPKSQFSFQINHFLKYAFLFLSIFGLIVIALAILQLDRNLTPFPTPKENGNLIRTGLYKFVRHPIYSGIILSAFGFGFYQGSLWKISVGIVLWILFHFKSKYEEYLLSKHFSDYEMYKKTTSRFFPFL